MGIRYAVIRIMAPAMSRTSPVVLYSPGKTPDIRIIRRLVTTVQQTEKAITFAAVSFALSNWLAPSCCPTIMATALPMAIKTTLNRLPMVDEIFVAATTVKPLTEKHWFTNAMPADQSASFTNRGDPFFTISKASLPGTRRLRYAPLINLFCAFR